MTNLLEIGGFLMERKEVYIMSERLDIEKINQLRRNGLVVTGNCTDTTHVIEIDFQSRESHRFAVTPHVIQTDEGAISLLVPTEIK